MFFSRMSMGIKVAELNTLSDGKGITGIRFFNEMENTNESTNVRKLADVRMSKNQCCQENRHRSAVGVTRITVLTSDIPINFKSTSFPEPKAAAKCPFSPNSTVKNHRSRVPNPSQASIAATQPLKTVKT